MSEEAKARMKESLRRGFSLELSFTPDRIEPIPPPKPQSDESVSDRAERLASRHTRYDGSAR